MNKTTMKLLMATLIKNSYDVLILLSSKIIYDFKIKEDDWEKVIELAKQNVKANVQNVQFARKRIKEYLAELDVTYLKKCNSNFTMELDCRKCYFKLIDWILQLSLKQPRLMRAVQKQRVAKNIVIEEMCEANKFLIHQDAIKKINIDSIIDRSIQTYLK